MLRLLANVAGRDGNLLLNVGPGPDGRIDPAQAARLREIGAWLGKYGESIYATRGGPFLPGDYGASTRRDTTYHQQNQPVEHDSTLEAATASLEARRVRAALGSLTAVQREAVELAYFGGYTHTEVAAMLQLPVGTAKTRIRDGLIRLRDTMGVGQ